jgi:hypothetical protein
VRRPASNSLQLLGVLDVSRLEDGEVPAVELEAGRDFGGEPGDERRREQLVHERGVLANQSEQLVAAVEFHALELKPLPALGGKLREVGATQLGSVATTRAG